MKMILLVIEGIWHHVTGQIWITSPVGEDCCPIPVYIVEEL
jgi:hypothetical protein